MTEEEDRIRLLEEMAEKLTDALIAWKRQHAGTLAVLEQTRRELRDAQQYIDSLKQDLLDQQAMG